MNTNNKFGLIAILLLSGLALIFSLNSAVDEKPNQDSTNEVEETEDIKPELEKDETEKTLKQFTANEFKQLFDSLSLPNTTPIVESPYITGDSEVDDHIVSLAEARGYSLRSVASGNLNEFEGNQLQELLINDWKDLATSAEAAGYNIKIRSGYRSVNEQRDLFVAQLNSLGLSNELISSGSYDQAIDDVLKQVAPPGYSRHHPGYTIDIYDPSQAVFEYSAAYQWIKSDNFAAAKEHGFIPSYPEGISLQGPNPEPWEYVWANRDFVVE